MVTTGHSWTHWVQDSGSLQMREYELEVNKTVEIKQQLVNSEKSSNTTFEWKHAAIVFLCLPGCAETAVRWSGKIKYHLTAYFLSNISAKKKLSKSVDVRWSYSNVNVSLKWCFVLSYTIIRPIYSQYVIGWLVFNCTLNTIQVISCL